MSKQRCSNVADCGRLILQTFIPLVSQFWKFLFSSESLEEKKQPVEQSKEVKRDESKEISVDEPPPVHTSAVNTTPTPISLSDDEEAKKGDNSAEDFTKPVENQAKPVEKHPKSIDTLLIKSGYSNELKNFGQDKETSLPPKQHNEMGTNLEKEGDGEQQTNKMMSFAEWKQKQDREKEIKEKSEFEEIEVVVEGTSTNKTVVIPKQKRKKELANKKNYASPNCGAKVVAANGEAQNKNSILTEDKDAYMLIPCNIKAWVVVELCERIQLDSIDFANFEMFSSTPKRFTIHVSNRFPTREWVHVDEFEATTGREVQTFNVKDKFYAKYVKVALLFHLHIVYIMLTHSRNLYNSF